MMPVEFSRLSLDVSALKRYDDLFDRLDSRGDIELLQWRYLDNPATGSLIDVAIESDSGRVVGINAIMSTRIVCGDRTALAGHSLDILVDPDCQTPGVLLKLASNGYLRARDSEMAMVYGFPNGNSKGVFFGRLRWKDLDPLPFMIRPLRSRYVVRQVKPGLSWIPNVPIPVVPSRNRRGPQVSIIPRFDERHEGLWRLFASQVGIAVDRSADYLNWRLVDKPGVTYQRIQIADGERVLGFAAYTVLGKHGGNVGYLMELVVDPSESGVADQLLAIVLRSMKRHSADVAMAWNLPHSPNHSAHRRAGFVPFPESRRPIELHFGARALDSEYSEITGDRDAWYVSYCDSDTV